MPATAQLPTTPGTCPHHRADQRARSPAPLAAATARGDQRQNLDLSLSCGRLAAELLGQQVHGDRTDQRIRVECPEDTAARLVQSALLNSRSGSLLDAAADLDQALAFGDRCPNRSRVMLEASQARIQLGELSAATTLAEDALAAARAAGDEPVVMLALGTLGQIHRRRGDHQAALTIAREGQERARRLGDDGERLTFALDESLALDARGDLDGALVAAVRARQIAERHCGPREQLRAAGRVGSVLRASGQLQNAEQAVAEGLRLARELNDPAEEAAFLTDLGALAQMRRRPADAADAFSAAFDVLARTGRWDPAAELVLEIVRVCTDPAQADLVWLAARAATLIALSCGPELRSPMESAAMKAVLRATALAPPASTEAGLVSVRQMLSAAAEDPHHPTPTPLLDVGVEAVVRWYVGLDFAADLMPEIERGLRVAPLLTQLLASTPHRPDPPGRYSSRSS